MMQTKRLSRWGIFALASVLMSGVVVAGCRVDESDIRRWESTERGPDKLVAVILHDKYEQPLRVEAALALVRMNPRGGRRVGIPLMTDAVAQVPDNVQIAIVSGMVPALVAEMVKPAPVQQAGQPPVSDPSVPFKDAAFALLTYDKGNRKIAVDPKDRQALRDALSTWVVTDFEHRWDNASQMYGVEQVIKHVGAGAVKGLPKLIDGETRKVAELARLIADHGDAPTKELASQKIVEVARYTISQAWIDKMKPHVEEANRAAKLKPNEEQFKMQLTAVQDEQLKKIFGAMRKLGGRAVVDYALEFALDAKNNADRRALAVAALEGNFDQKNPNDVQKILALAAADDTPDKVRDLAFRRVGEMPRDKVISKLYEIFNNKRWQVRWVAAQYAIQMSDTTQVQEILDRLPKGRADNFAMTEALTYGDWMGDPAKMQEKGGKTGRDQLTPFLRDSNIAAKTTAAGWFYGHGTTSDLPMLNELTGDRTALPKCDSDQTNCEWRCYVDKPGGKEGEKEAKDPTSFGEFVQYCIIPNMKDRKVDPAKDKDKTK